MCIMSNADGKNHSVSHVFIGICIAYVESSYCNTVAVVVFLTHHLTHHR